MENIWLKSYEEGVPAEIDPNQYHSLADLFHTSCRRFAAKPALSNLSTTLSYTQWHQSSTDFASYLQNVLHKKKGDRIAIMMPNLLQYPVVLLGILMAGLVVVNVNPLYKPEELEHQLLDADLDTIVVLSNFAHTVAAVEASCGLKHVIVTQVGDLFPAWKKRFYNFAVKYIKRMIPAYHLSHERSFTSALQEGAALPFIPVEIGGDDIAFLQYTGGTTGVPKAAVLTHRNLIANVTQASAWMQSLVVYGEEIIITALPLYHIFSLTANCISFMLFGAMNVLITNPRDINALIKQIKGIPFGFISGVNTLFNVLLNNPKFVQCDFSHLKMTLGGGMAVQQSVAKRWKAVTGCALLEAYGLTETSPAVTMTPMNIKEFKGSIGVPLPSTEIKLVDAHGHEVKLGDSGELLVRGPQVMREYWRKPEETAKVFTHDGWLHTGDVAKMDSDGYVYLVDRIKDMILVSGFNVYPNEVEHVISGCEGVFEVGVIGVKDEAHGEVVMAFVVKKDPTLTKERVIEYCREHLTGYKVPKLIQFVDELPKSTVGKILRRELRQLRESAE